jgi:hypothetical protein
LSALTSSHPRPPLSNADLDRAEACRAQARRLRRHIMRIERRIHRTQPPADFPRVRQPADAEAVLAAIATRFKAGDRVGIKDIADAAGVPEHAAHHVKRWAKSVDRWPYEDALSGYNAARAAKGGGPC